MKKLVYIILTLGLVTTFGCDPLDEIHDAIDATDPVIVGNAEYTLTDEDYDDLGLSYGNFSSEEDAKAMLPPFLSEKYPVWGKGSSVLIGYDLYVGNAPGVSDYTYADHYELEESDYADSGSDVRGFYPDVDPTDFLGDVLDANVTDAADGEHILVKYRQYVDVPNKIVTSNYSLEDNFDYGAAAADLTAVASNWTKHSGSSTVGYSPTGLSMADYPSSDIGGSIVISSSNSEDVNSVFSAKQDGIVYSSALVNFSFAGSGTYFFHFMDDGFGYSGRVGVKSDGNGQILFGIGATSSSLTYGTTAYDLDTTYLIVASYNIDTGVANLYVLTAPEATEPATPEATNTGDSGRMVQKIGIRQGSGGSSGMIDGVRVATSWADIMVNDVAVEVEGSYMRKELFYTNDGGDWEESEGVYFMQDADFDSMGEASGQPGRYNNFGSSTPPDDYLPTFLKIKYPYALEEDQLFVIYDYFSSSSGAQIRGNLYTVVNGEWVGHESVMATSLQFGHDGRVWVPDNTIKYTLTAADYTYIVDTYSNTYPSQTSNMAAYGNFNGFSWTMDMINEVIGAVLLNNFPGMAEGQKFRVTYSIYDGSTHDDVTNLILQGGVYVPL
jgi:hypothetical protein